VLVAVAHVVRQCLAQAKAVAVGANVALRWTVPVAAVSVAHQWIVLVAAVSVVRPWIAPAVVVNVVLQWIVLEVNYVC
jgi:hypothetical protein